MDVVSEEKKSLQKALQKLIREGFNFCFLQCIDKIVWGLKVTLK